MIKFGPSGNDELFYSTGHKSTIEAGRWLNEIGLDAYEYSFGRGIRLSNETAQMICEEFMKYNITVSVHAPYFINFANPDEEKIQNSFKYVLDSCRLCKLMGGKRVVVHTGTQGKLTRSEALQLCKNRLVMLKEKLLEENLDDCIICFETMGKYSQIGDYLEIVDLCKISDNFLPTFDFGHINCTLKGNLKSKNDFMNILNYAIKELGYNKIKNVHIHFSKIEFSDKGEIRHLTLEDKKYGPEFEPLAQAILELKLEPVIICESNSIMAQDALKLKKIYTNLVDKLKKI